MRIASNKLIDCIRFYHAELSNIYDKNEIDAIFYLVADHFLGFERTKVQTNLQSNINQSDLIKLYQCCSKLRKQIPVQYILGSAWFYGLKFLVSPQVLIPRPETEELVDLIVKENQDSVSFLDFGTGSGCIPISIKKQIPSAQVFAIDLSSEALLIAEKNAANHFTEIVFINADILMDDFSIKLLNKQVQIVISNPPYIMSNEKNKMSQLVLKNEPHLALFVEGEDDILFYKKIINACEHILVSGGKLYFELNPLTANLVKLYTIQSQLFLEVKLINDMSGKTRFLKATKK